MGWKYHEASDQMVFAYGNFDFEEYFDDEGRLLSQEDFAEMDVSPPVTAPAKWEVCDCCHGRGTTVLGWGADGDYHVMTCADWDADPEDCQLVMDGHYDRPCPVCKGRTTVRGPDLTCLSSTELEWVREVEKEERYDAAVERAERRMGC